MTTTSIRPVRSDDFNAIAAITNHYITTTPIHFAVEPVDAASLSQAWLATSTTHPFLVAIEQDPDGEGAVVGFAKAGIWRERAGYARTAETGIYVRADRVRSGIGRPLYSAVIDACREAGFRTLVAGVVLPSPGSVRLHESCGFTRVGVFREVGRKFDAWHDVAWYQQMLCGA